MHSANTLKGQFGMCKLMRKQCWHFVLVYDLPYAECVEPCPYIFIEGNSQVGFYKHRCSLYTLSSCLT